MKISTKTSAKKLYLLIVGAFILISVLFVSCAKEIEVETYSYLSITNSSPTLGTYNIYLDGNQSNASGALAFGGMMAYGTLTSGEHTLKFTTESNTDALLTKTITMEDNGIYSAFLIDRAENMDLLVVKDDLSTASTEKAFVRFINLSPDAPSLDLSVAEGEALISGKTYKSASSFQTIDPNTYTFNIKDQSTGLTIATVANQELTAGRYYTIISKGMVTAGDTDQPFGAQLIINL